MSLFGSTKVKECIVGNIHKVKQIPGYSAYEIAVKHGFKGTEEEWLKSLKGEKGDTGTLESHTEVDALGHRVINVAEPTEDTDAVNLSYFKANCKADFALLPLENVGGGRYILDGMSNRAILAAYPYNPAEYTCEVECDASEGRWYIIFTDKLTNNPPDAALLMLAYVLSVKI